MFGFIIFLVVCIVISVMVMIGGLIKDIKEQKYPVVKIIMTIGLVAAVIGSIVYLCDDSVV